MELPTFTTKKRKKKKIRKKMENHLNTNQNDSVTRFDFICFGFALLVFVSTYFYVEIMNTHQDTKERSVLGASRYGIKNVEKLKGKVKNLKRKIRVLRKQLSEDDNTIASREHNEPRPRVINEANHAEASPKFESSVQHDTDESKDSRVEAYSIQHGTDEFKGQYQE